MADRDLGKVHQCGCTTCKTQPRSGEAQAHARINRMVSTLDEKNARRVVGLLAEGRGHGGVSLLSRVTGMSRNTIALGQSELRGKDPVPADRIRRPGGGRPPLEKKRRN